MERFQRHGPQTSAITASQAQKFDPEGEYIREWLPELRSVDTEFLLSGNISEQERDTLGYPAPIVDHKQRRQFKALYQQQKVKKIEPLQREGYT